MFIAQEPQIPSRQERRNVSVGSTSFFILISASKIMGPHLESIMCAAGETLFSHGVMQTGICRTLPLTLTIPDANEYSSY